MAKEDQKLEDAARATLNDLLEGRRCYETEPGESETEMHERIETEEDRFLAIAAKRLMLVLFSFNEARRFKLLQILSVIATDPKDAQRDRSETMMWETIAGLVPVLIATLSKPSPPAKTRASIDFGDFLISLSNEQSKALHEVLTPSQRDLLRQLGLVWKDDPPTPTQA